MVLHCQLLLCGRHEREHKRQPATKERFVKHIPARDALSKKPLNKPILVAPNTNCA
jgi:hypothetical protein